MRLAVDTRSILSLHSAATDYTLPIVKADTTTYSIFK